MYYCYSPGWDQCGEERVVCQDLHPVNHTPHLRHGSRHHHLSGSVGHSYCRCYCSRHLPNGLCLFLFLRVELNDHWNRRNVPGYHRFKNEEISINVHGVISANEGWVFENHFRSQWVITHASDSLSNFERIAWAHWGKLTITTVLNFPCLVD
jgi:hypothetical protein